MFFKKPASTVQKLFSLSFIIVFFWSIFWITNGYDKFFNGKWEPMVEPGLEKLVLQNRETKKLEYDAYAYEVNGLFGVNRNKKMITFFERIGLSPSVAIGSLYLISIIEILLGFVFLGCGLLSVFKKDNYHVSDSWHLKAVFKLSIILFAVFCAGDVLFGERMELWEHVTFMTSLIITYVIVFSGEFFGKQID